MDKVGLSGKYQTYPEYKRISSKWVAEIPTHWQSIFFKRIVIGIKDGTHGTHVRVNEGLPFLSAKNVMYSGINISDSESMISKKDHQEITGNGFPKKGDLLITCVGTIGRTCVYEFDEPHAFQRSVAFLRLSRLAESKFYKYFVESKPYQSQLEAQSKASAQSGVYMGDLINTLTVLPPKNEQQKIANFLDYETAKIDTLIEKQQQLIKLLKEKRQAVISHAVTKGLNPNAPMRDSGVEWLGQVPEHWDVARFKHLVHEGVAGPYGSSLTKSMYLLKGIRVYGQQQVIPDDFSVGDYYISEKKFEEMRRYEVFPNDILISVMGTVGKVAVAPENIERGIINPRLVKYKVMEDKVHPYFIKLSIGSDVSQSRLLFSSQGSTMDGLNMQILGELPIPYPPSLNDQTEILNEVSRQDDKFENLLRKTQVTVELLSERRTALISAAVTGKIDVRDWVAPESANNTMDARLRGNDAELNAAVDVNTEADLSKEAGL